MPSTPPPDEQPQASSRRLAALAEVLLIFLLFFVHAGSPVPNVNEAHYVGKAKHYWNPDWCRGDFFFESSDAHLVFYWSLGWMAKFMSLPAATWAMRVLTWLLLAWGWWRMSHAVVPGRLTPVLSAAIFLAVNSLAHMAGEWVVGGVEAKGIAYGWLLLALGALGRGRWWTAGLLLGASAAFHVLVGGWSIVALVFVWLAVKRERPSPVVLIGAVLVATLVALPGLIPALQLTAEQTPETLAEATRVYVFERLPHHLAMLSLRHDDAQARLLRHSVAVLTCAVLFCIWAFTRGEQSRRVSIQRASAYVVAAFSIALVGLCIELVTRGRPEVGAPLLRYYWYRLSDFAVPLGVAVMAVAVLSNLLARFPRAGAAWLLLAMALPGWHFYQVLHDRITDPHPPGEDVKKVRNLEDWVDVTDWVRNNVPEGIRFLTPRGQLTFKWRTGHPEVVNRKDIPQDAEGILEWKRRMKQLHGKTVIKPGKSPYIRSLGHVGKERVVRMAKKYDAPYVLSDTRKPLALPILYRNKTYAVYRVP